MESPPINLEGKLKEYLSRVFNEIDRRFNAVGKYSPTTVLPIKPEQGRTYYFPNTVLPTITSAGLWLYSSTGWKFCGSTGVAGPPGSVSQGTELALFIDDDYPDAYKTFSYDGSGRLSATELYQNSGMSNHLMGCAFTYDGSGRITQTVSTDHRAGGSTLTRTFTYDGSGRLSSVS